MGNFQVLDMVLSHQALPRKVQLVATILDTLVAPCAQHFKPQLAQLAQLPTMPPLQHIVQRAQQLLDHAFLSDLSAAIASSLVTTPTEGSSPPGDVSTSGGGSLSAMGGEIESESRQVRAACKGITDAYCTMLTVQAAVSITHQHHSDYHLELIHWRSTC